MAVPSSFADSESYLTECIHFLKKYDWIYNYRNTDILVNKIFDKITSSWITYLSNITSDELNKLAFAEVDESAPSGLKHFVFEVNCLKPHFENFRRNESFSFPKNVSIGVKKLHEITSLAPLVQHVCQESNVSNVMDIGCGLGYLSHLLNEKYNYNVLGVEGCQDKMLLANAYQQKYYNDSKENVKYLYHYITDSSSEELNAAITNTCHGEVCVVGLHACADLSITILDVFKKMKSAKCLVVMPCCYHRLKLKRYDENLETFMNFPSSNLLQNICTAEDGSSFLRRPFLRLATQQSCESWRNMGDTAHDVHAKNCLFRAILQEIAQEDKYKIKRLKRKSGKSTKSEIFDAESFAQNLTNSHLFTAEDTGAIVDYNLVKSKFLEKWCLNREKLVLTEALAALQAAVQSVSENVVLLDRVEYLKQNGLSASVYKVTDDWLSPRCYALVAIKQ